MRLFKSIEIEGAPALGKSEKLTTTKGSTLMVSSAQNFNDKGYTSEEEREIRMMKPKVVKYDDLITDLRVKYIEILKSQYMHAFEAGQMDPDTVATLIESADVALDANFPTPTLTPPKIPNPNKLPDWEWIYGEF